MKTEKNPKISICVVTYNHEKYIRKCLQSILDQKTDFDFEVIIGEDCSTDNTRAIIQTFFESYPNIIKPIFYEKNIGATRNYFNVHSHASGEYIAHCDGDDYWLPEKLQSQINFMIRHKACSAVYTNAWVMTDSNDVLGIFSSGVKPLFDISYLIQKSNFLTHSSLVYRTKFREFVVPSSGDFVDFLIHIRLAQCGQLGFIDECLVSYTNHSTTSVILSHNTKVRLLFWDALNEVNESQVNKKVLDNTKFSFIADAIIFELIHGSWCNISDWISLNNKGKYIFLLYIKLFNYIAFSISLKIINRFSVFFNKVFNKADKNSVVFYKI